VANFEQAAAEIVALCRRAYARGWVLGTSGNFSAVVSDVPLRLAVTASGIDKGRVHAGQILEVDATGRTADAELRPSAELSLHLAVVRAKAARAVAHTHSAWSTLVSDRHAAAGGIAIEGYEMLKGLRGVTTHAHREWLPIIENTQDWPAEAPRVEALLQRHSDSRGFLIRRHGLYTWGEDVAEAGRHLEVLEFLLEVSGRAELATR
jgi:methylthioribulose-1-phosphate dehydratase